MKRLLAFVLMIMPLWTHAAVSQMNALSWCKADGTDQTAKMQLAVNAAVTAKQPLYVPYGIKFTWASLTNTTDLLMEDYSTNGMQRIRGTLAIESGIADTVNTDELYLEGLRIYAGAIDVRSYNATVDDVTDDTTAIQAAFDAGVADNKPVRFSEGTYLATSLVVTGALDIICDARTIIKQSSSATDSLIKVTGSNADEVRLFGGIIDGNWQNQIARADNQVNASSIICVTNSNKRLILDGVTLTNSIRAAVRVAGPAVFHNTKFLNIKTNSCTGDGTAGTTYAVWAQPTGFNADLHILVDGCEFIGHTGEDMDLVYLAGQGVWISEQENMSPTTLNTNRYTATVVNNRFVGLGGWFGVTEGAPIEIYNGADRPIVMGNTISCFAQSAIKVQRTGRAIISGNQIRNGRNAFAGLAGAYLGVSQAIIFDPTAREGYAPFIGARAGEEHYNAIIANNVIENVQQTAIQTTGEHTLIQGNLIDGVEYGHENAPGFFLLDCISIQASNVDVIGNTIKNVGGNSIIATGSYSDIRVLENKLVADGATNTRGGIVFANISGLEIRGNYLLQSLTNLGSGIYLDTVTNAVIAANTVINAAEGYHVSGCTNVAIMENVARAALQELALTTSTNCFQWNNSWKRGYAVVDKLTQSAMGLSTTDTNIGASFTIEAGAKYFELAGVGHDGEFLPGSKQGDAVIDFSGDNLLVGRPGKAILTLDATADRMQLNGPLWIVTTNSQLTFLSLTDNTVPTYFTWYYYPGGVSTQRGWMGYSTSGSDTLYVRNALNSGIYLWDDSVTVSSNLTVNGSLKTSTTNHIVFGATNTAPSGGVTPTKWISVQINGEGTAYRIPLYE